MESESKNPKTELQSSSWEREGRRWYKKKKKNGIMRMSTNEILFEFIHVCAFLTISNFEREREREAGEKLTTNQFISIRNMKIRKCVLQFCGICLLWKCHHYDSVYLFVYFLFERVSDCCMAYNILQFPPKKIHKIFLLWCVPYIPTIQYFSHNFSCLILIWRGSTSIIVRS